MRNNVDALNNLGRSEEALALADEGEGSPGSTAASAPRACSSPTTGPRRWRRWAGGTRPSRPSSGPSPWTRPLRTAGTCSRSARTSRSPAARRTRRGRPAEVGAFTRARRSSRQESDEQRPAALRLAPAGGEPLAALAWPRPSSRRPAAAPQGHARLAAARLLHGVCDAAGIAARPGRARCASRPTRWPRPERRRAGERGVRARLPRRFDAAAAAWERLGRPHAGPRHCCSGAWRRRDGRPRGRRGTAARGLPARGRARPRPWSTEIESLARRLGVLCPRRRRPNPYGRPT